MSRALARATWMLAVLAGGVGCDDGLPSWRALSFACTSDDECVVGTCVDGVCDARVLLLPDGGRVVDADGGADEDGGAPFDDGGALDDGGQFDDGGALDAGGVDGGALDDDGGVEDGGGGFDDGGGGDAGLEDGGLDDAGLDDGGAPDGGVDAGDADAGFDAGAPPCPGPVLPAPCDATDPELAVCFTFDADVQAATMTIDDGSARGNDGTVTGATLVGGAIDVGGSSGIGVRDGPGTDDVDGFAAMLRLNARSVPPVGGTRMGLVDDDGQYGLFVVPGGAIRCTTPATTALETAPIQAGVWLHVACAFDPTTGARLWVDGALVAEAPNAGGVINVGGTNGVGVGRNSPSGDVFDGLLDDVRIYGRAITDGEACWAAR